MVHNDDKSLKELIQKSDFIFLVEKIGRTENGLDSTDNFKVKEVVFAKTTVPLETVVYVADANINFNKSMAEHIQKKGYDGAPSPLFPRYNGKSQPSDKTAIIFLNKLNGKPTQYKYAMNGATESEGQLAQVKEETKKLKNSL